MHLDANNLYDWTVMQLLPVGGFQWVDISIDQVLATPDDGNEGHVVEVDIEYPEHDIHDTVRCPLLLPTCARSNICS